MSTDTFHLGIKALVCDASGRILLLKVNTAQLQNTIEAYWDLPGGRLEKGQTIEETLRREIQEELGVAQAAITKQIGMVLSNIRIPVGEDSVGLILGIYGCDMPDDSRIILSDEHVAYDWFTPVEAAKLLTVKYPKDLCDQVAAM